MRRQKLGAIAALFGIAMLAGQSAADAQSPPDAPATPPAGTDASAGLAREVKLSPAEQVRTGEGFLNRMNTTRTTVRRMLGEARNARDVVKTLCLNDKLNQIDVAIRSGRERQTALESASKSNDADLSSHEFTILSVLKQRVDSLSAEAQTCIGQEAGFIGDSSVTSTVDNTLPDDPTEQPDDDGFIVDPPACTSCFK